MAFLAPPVVGWACVRVADAPMVSLVAGSAFRRSFSEASTASTRDEEAEVTPKSAARSVAPPPCPASPPFRAKTRADLLADLSAGGARANDARGQLVASVWSLLDEDDGTTALLDAMKAGGRAVVNAVAAALTGS